MEKENFDLCIFNVPVAFIEESSAESRVSRLCKLMLCCPQGQLRGFSLEFPRDALKFTYFSFMLIFF